jgi:TolB-like protein
VKKTKDIIAQDIKDALARVIASADFARSARQVRFLKFLVAEFLAGRADKIKGYSIGVEVFDKDESFNPESDTIVRVYAGRLRRMLETYYLTEGKADPVIIEVPKGGYAPAFRRNREKKSAKPFFRRPLVLVFAVLLVIIAGLTGMLAWQFVSVDSGAGEAEKLGKMASAAKQMPSGPRVAVLPFTDITEAGMKRHFIHGLAMQIIVNLTRFKDLFVLGPDTTLNRPEFRRNILNAGRKLGVRYILAGTVAETRDEIYVTARLLESKSGRIVWSKSFQRIKTGDNLFEIQKRISSSVASVLGQPYGIINRLESRQSMGQDNVSMSAYSCYLRYFNYVQNESAKTHLVVRDCLEKAVKDAPGFAQAWAALSWMYVNEYRQGYNVKVGDTPPLDRALSAARKAVELDPDDSFTHQRLADVLITRGNKDLARREIMRAMELNPNNADVLADVGWILKTHGKWAEAYWLTRRAIKLNPGHPPWYLETIFLYYYKNLDCKNARPVARSHYRANSDSLLPHMYLVLAATMCGSEDEVENSVKILNTFYPGFLRHPEKTLKKLATPEGLIESIINDLADAGVEFVSEDAEGNN